MSTNNIEKSFNPSAEFRFFIFDAMDGYFIYFKTAEDRDKASDGIIQGYLDDGWDEMVEQVVAGEITHTCAKIDIVVRPPEDEIDEDGHDQDGNYWGEEWDCKCNYTLAPIGSGQEGGDA